MARPAGDSTFQASTSIFATTRSTPGTASRIAVASRLDSPADFLRISVSSFSRSKRLSFTTTFRRPIASMISSAWRSAPAPIESIAITAPTPKMIPSIARSERSAWWRRLSMPELSDSRRSITSPAPTARQPPRTPAVA